MDGKQVADLHFSELALFGFQLGQLSDGLVECPFHPVDLSRYVLRIHTPLGNLEFLGVQYDGRGGCDTW